MKSLFRSVKKWLSVASVEIPNPDLQTLEGVRIGLVGWFDLKDLNLLRNLYYMGKVHKEYSADSSVSEGSGGMKYDFLDEIIIWWVTDDKSNYENTQHVLSQADVAFVSLDNGALDPEYLEEHKETWIGRFLKPVLQAVKDSNLPTLYAIPRHVEQSTLDEFCRRLEIPKSAHIMMYDSQDADTLKPVLIKLVELSHTEI